MRKDYNEVEIGVLLFLWDALSYEFMIEDGRVTGVAM